MENETQDLETGIGNKEAVSLTASKVIIESVDIQEVGEKKSKKVVCKVKHPDKEEPITISSVKYIKGDKVTESGLWFNQDEDKLIRKGSALAIFMQKIGATKLSNMNNLTVETEQDSKGYLTFRAY